MINPRQNQNKWKDSRTHTEKKRDIAKQYFLLTALTNGFVISYGTPSIILSIFLIITIILFAGYVKAEFAC